MSRAPGFLASKLTSPFANRHPTAMAMMVLIVFHPNEGCNYGP
jgi:hypothetical protein